jgi:hypothetical protein
LIAQINNAHFLVSHKVEWLYTGDKIDREAYLLGKPIDKLLIEKEIEKRLSNLLNFNNF